MIDVNCSHYPVKQWHDYHPASEMTDYVLDQIHQWFVVHFVNAVDDVRYPYRDIWVLVGEDCMELHFANQAIFYNLFPSPDIWFNFREVMNQRTGSSIFVEMHDDAIH